MLNWENKRTSITILHNLFWQIIPYELTPLKLKKFHHLLENVLRIKKPTLHSLDGGRTPCLVKLQIVPVTLLKWGFYGRRFPRNFVKCIKALFLTFISERLSLKHQNVLEVFSELFIFVEVNTVDTITYLRNIPEQTLTYKHRWSQISNISCYNKKIDKSTKSITQHKAKA